MAETQESLTERVRRRAEERSAQIAAVLKPLVERPGPLTCYEAEKALHEATRKLADDIFADVLRAVTRDPAFTATAVRNTAKKGGDASMTASAGPRSNSGAGPS